MSGYPITRFIPNMATLLGLSVGLTSVYHALNQDWEKAVWFVVIATVFDGMDGRLARFFNASSRFGAELDSLSDFVSFGVSPALLAYFFALNQLGRLGWGVVLFFCICSGLRLAHFNTVSIEEEMEPGSKLLQLQKKYFTGIPMPAAGVLALVPIMLYLDSDYRLPPTMYALYAVSIAGLMVAKIPTFSFKGVKIQPNQVMFLLGAIAVVVIGMMVRPWLTLPVVGGAYLATFVFSFISYRKDFS